MLNAKARDRSRTLVAFFLCLSVQTDRIFAAIPVPADRSVSNDSAWVEGKRSCHRNRSYLIPIFPFDNGYTVFVETQPAGTISAEFYGLID